MIVKYNEEKLLQIIKSIVDLTGMSISVVDADYHPIVSYTPKQDYCSLLQTARENIEKCRQCDKELLKQCRAHKKTEHHICWAGLYDSAMPIIKNDIVVGYALMGRVRSERSPALPLSPTDSACTVDRISELYGKIPFIPESKLSALYDLLSHILFEPAIQIVYDSLTKEAVEYIRANLHENLSVDRLCQAFHVSKNYLYKAFADTFGSTVNAYIAAQRLKRAKELLTESDSPVYAVAEKVGIDNYPYFCRWFKKSTGFTPGEYRKASRK
ncbi:MAG: helix-turn-helix domain-containing protein [Ruminococcaceae bacterium]|nr:helix-turn-helix domain-containing protein [Oscillospiraceae bacterium]